MSCAALSWFVSVHALVTVPVQLPEAVVTQSSTCTPRAALITGDLYPNIACVRAPTVKHQHFLPPVDFKMDVCHSGKMYALNLVPELGFSVLLWCYEP